MNHIILIRCPATHNANSALIKNLPELQTVYEGVQSVSSDTEAMKQRLICWQQAFFFKLLTEQMSSCRRQCHMLRQLFGMFSTTDPFDYVVAP